MYFKIIILLYIIIYININLIFIIYYSNELLNILILKFDNNDLIYIISIKFLI